MGAADDVPYRSLPVRRTADGGCAGTLAEWQAKVARPALTSPIASVTLLASFAAPLMAFSSLNEGFIINLAGRSSGGNRRRTGLPRRSGGTPIIIPVGTAPRVLWLSLPLPPATCR